MHEFTLGPWQLNARNQFVVEPSAPSFDAVATVQVSNRENWQANAHLIAAAPDLYEALEQAARHIPDGFGELYDVCVAALAKARGE